MTDDQCQLSEGQVDVLRWLAEGKKADETSSILGISVSTVNMRIHLAKNRTGASTSAGLVAMAIRKGWIQ